MKAQEIVGISYYSEKSCIYCSHFYSFCDKHEDDKEDADYGECTNPNNPDRDNFVGYDKTCNLFEK